MRKLFIILVVFLGINLASISVSAAPLQVVTSIETLASLAQAVGQDKINVVSLSKGYQDPHFVEAKPSLMVTLSKADLLIYVGLDLEIGWLPPLVAGSRNARIQPGAPGNVEASSAIDVLDIPSGPVNRSQGDIHPRGNPHYWIPPVNALKIARLISQKLAQIDPANRAAYEANLIAFANQLKARVSVWSQKTAALRDLPVVTYHRSWTYVSQWLGLKEVGYVENRPGIAPDPKHLADLVTLMKSQSVRLVLIESFHNRALASQVADLAGARLVVLPSDVGATTSVKSYIDLVDTVIDLLAKARQ